MTDEKTSKKKRGRGIYLLPNLFTVAGLFAGFYAIISATQHHYDVAAIAIFVAMVLDGLDGRIARLTQSQSEFGAQLDSLSDMVCFGITPALVLFNWSLSSLGKIGWLAAFIYAVCTALRLARFNSQSQQENKRYFQGLSTTACAGFVASVIWAATEYHVDGVYYAPLVAIVTVALALCMVSTIRYRSFKDLDLRGKVPFMVILAVVLVIVIISTDPPLVFFAIFLAYVLSGPIGTLWHWRYFLKKKQSRRGKKKD